jgi:hypothetical protein
MAPPPILPTLLLCAALIGALAQQEDPSSTLRRAAAGGGGGGGGSHNNGDPASSSAAERGRVARERAIGAQMAAAARGGDDATKDRGDLAQRQQPARSASSSSSSSSPSSSSSAAAMRRQRLRTAAGGAGGGPGSSGGGLSTPADYTYIPLDGRVLLRPRSITKLRDYTADLYGGINQVAQAQPFFAAASVAGRVGVAARYSVDYSDYLSPRQALSRIGPTSHLATAATARAQGSAGFKAATDSVATRRASYRYDLADGSLLEAGVVGQRLNVASAGATVERDQANDPFYAAVADVGPGLIGRRRKRRTL